MGVGAGADEEDEDEEERLEVEDCCLLREGGKGSVSGMLDNRDGMNGVEWGNG